MRRLLCLLALAVAPVALALTRSTAAAPSRYEDVIDMALAGVDVGQPLRYEQLIVFPLESTGKAPYGQLPAELATLDEALHEGYLTITEVGAGRVNEVYVDNTSGRYVFMMAGEVIAGAKQDRMISHDTLVPPKSGRIVVGVYCTERGRWSDTAAAFGASGIGVYPGLRATAIASGSQSAVWDEIRRKRASAAASAPTEALRSIQTDARVQRRIQSYRESQLGKLPETSPRVVGAVVFTRWGVSAVDLFGSHDLLRRLWGKLLDSYAMEAVGPDDRAVPPSWTADPSAARRFLRRVAAASIERRSTPGVGRLWALRNADVTGEALTFQEGLVHLEAFPARGLQPLREGEPGSLSSPYRVVPRPGPPRM
jgi:hypothetical protein